MHFIDYAVDARGSGEQFHAEGGGVVGDEVVAVEAVEVVVADPAGHGGDVVDVGVGDHCGHGRVGVFGYEFYCFVGGRPRERLVVSYLHVAGFEV